MEKSLRIVKLEAENVKRLKVVVIKPDGSLVRITGRNGAGKSSVLDSIEWAIGGKCSQPKRPVRDGAESASVVLDLGELIVKRNWTDDTHSYLSVENSSGKKFASPQAILDEMRTRLMFDPLAFTRLSPVQQVAQLKEMLGLDFRELDDDRAEAYENRTMIGRDMRAKLQQIESFGSIGVDVPDEEISVTDLSREHADALRKRQDIELARRRTGELERHVADANDKIVDLMKRLDEARKNKSDYEAMLRNQNKVLESLPAAPSTDDIEQKMEDAELLNASVRRKKDFEKLRTEATELDRTYKSLAAEIEAIDQRKAGMIQKAKLPIPGLNFTDEGITLNGLPFEQASGAEQLRVSASIAMAMNPRLRIMLIRDGSLLDTDNLKLLEKIATEQDVQVWLECVSDGGKVGVVIEDGMVKK